MINPQSLRLEPEEEGRRNLIAANINQSLERFQKDSRPKDYPKTAEDWWRNVDAWWPELLSLINSFNTRLSDLPPLEEGHFEVAGVVLERMKAARDTKLSGILSTTWFNAPDNGSIHGLPGWHILCDLCSESGVLFDGPPDEIGNTFDERPV